VNTGADAAWYQILDDTEKTYSIINNSGVIEVAKSTDPETASSFSNQDAANNPTATPEQVWGVDIDSDKVQLGAIFMIDSDVVASGMDDLLTVGFHVFDLATDTWVVTDEAVGSLSSTDSQDMIAGDCSSSLCVFTNGVVFAEFNGVAGSAMGSGFQRVYYSRKTSASWAAPILMHTVPTAKENWHGSVVVDGSSDRAHCYFTNVALEDGYQRTYAEGTGIETMPSAGDATVLAIRHAFCKGVSYDDAGTRRVRVPYADASNHLSSAKIDSATAPGAFTSDASLQTASGVASTSSTMIAAFAADGTTLHAVFSANVANKDTYHNENADDAGWGTDDQPFSATLDTATINHVSANVYTRAGTVRLAVVVLDGTTVRYDEHPLSAPATSLVSPNTFIRRFPHLRM
jgi:hypothetical protein